MQLATQAAVIDRDNVTKRCYDWPGRRMKGSRAMGKLVLYQLRDSIATITMDDGKVNVLSPQMLTELNEALDRAEADRAVVMLTGRPGVFSAGFDLTVLRAGGSP